MKKISVAVATFNEEENIGPCLETVKDWVNEMVVVDGGSQDRTREIARKLGAKVIKTTNKPIFHINKQMAIDAATGDWILQLDADERVTPELRAEIIEMVKSKTEFDGFWIPRKNYFLGRYLKKGGQYPDYTLRLYRKGKGRLPCQSVHEQAEVQGRAGYLKNDLLHLADPSFSRYLLRFDRYTSLMAEEFRKKKVRLDWLGGLQYLLIKPSQWFLLTYFRHKGFVDGFPGFVFSLFSGLRFMVAYIKYWEKQNES
jgi:glycosyltransferase involved in cell wall biosynthesis